MMINNYMENIAKKRSSSMAVCLLNRVSAPAKQAKIGDLRGPRITGNVFRARRGDGNG